MKTECKPSPPRPDFSLEMAAGAAAGLRVCGLDEVGRGPLAGPVTAAAVILPPHGLSSALAAAVDDSKRLSPRRRAELEPLLRAEVTAFALGWASVAEIDQINILQAALLAMERAVATLGVVPDFALVDGRILPRNLPCPAQAVVKGDQRSLSIAAASIIAKEARDHEMLRLHRAYPHYGWDHNAGYPTAAHLAALKRHGATPHHRCSFAPLREEDAVKR